MTVADYKFRARLTALFCCGVFGLFGLQAYAQDQDQDHDEYARHLAEWNDERAGLFSSVCMKSAPDFAEFGTFAAAAGFERHGEGWMKEPEVGVSLAKSDDGCSCFMSMGAPDQTALVTAIFTRVQGDFPGAWRPAGPQGVVNDTVFDRDGTDVRMVLFPETFESQPWIAASLFSPKECPA